MEAARGVLRRSIQGYVDSTKAANRIADVDGVRVPYVIKSQNLLLQVDARFKQIATIHAGQ
jgi:hypothetical protein